MTTLDLTFIAFEEVVMMHNILLERYGGSKGIRDTREEERMHVHVYAPDGIAKFWMEPEIALATSHGLPKKQLNELLGVVNEHAEEIRKSWRKHFSC